MEPRCVGWGLLTHRKFGPAFFKERHGDSAENYLILNRHNDCMILLTYSDNGELAFRPLLQQLFGDTVTPWMWEGYTRASRSSPIPSTIRKMRTDLRRVAAITMQRRSAP